MREPHVNTARPCILIDTREQRPWTFSPAVDVEPCTLPSGDYSITGCTDAIVIERKSLPDLVASITRERERFVDEVRRMQSYPLRCIIVEASIEAVHAGAYRSRTAPQSVIGTMLAFHVDYGCPTIWAGDASTAANVAERLLVRAWRKRAAVAA